MPTTTDLHLVLSRELDTEELSLEHDTVVVSAEFSKRVIEALKGGATEAVVIPPPARGAPCSP